MSKKNLPFHVITVGRGSVDFGPFCAVSITQVSMNLRRVWLEIELSFHQSSHIQSSTADTFFLCHSEIGFTISVAHVAF